MKAHLSRHRPATPTVDRVDNYHGTSVADPYHWLEDVEAPDTRAWVAEQNRLAERYLGGIVTRTAILRRLESLVGATELSAPVDRPSPSDAFYDNCEKVPSPGGSLIAYGRSEGGSDWQEWRVRRIHGDRDLPDRLAGIRSGAIAWTRDSRGFFYSRQHCATGSLGSSLYYHVVGTPQSEDRLVYRPDGPNWNVHGQGSEDGRYLVVSAWPGSDVRNLLLYLDLSASSSRAVPLIARLEAKYSLVAAETSVLWLLVQDLVVPNGRVVAMDLRRPQRANWREIVPGGPDPLVGVKKVGNHLVSLHLQDGCLRVTVWDLDGAPVSQVPLPGCGWVDGIRAVGDGVISYRFSSLVQPPTTYRHRIPTDQTTAAEQPSASVNAEDYVVRRVFYPGKDSTSIPMFIGHRKGLRLDGRNPAYIHVYGGFGEPVKPAFSAEARVWMDLGGVYAMPCVRGGGEYGRAWHQAAIRRRKRVTFDDAIAAAEWLVDGGYTCPGKLGIGGASNGGLTAAACITRRPGLFGAALLVNAPLDMLRFPAFGIGSAWECEYGSPQDAQDFKALYAYSPLHRLRPGTAYPATLVMASDHDDRVGRAHSYKFVAALQAFNAGPSPAILRICPESGHGGGATLSRRVEEAADRLAFMSDEFRISGLDSAP